MAKTDAPQINSQDALIDLISKANPDTKAKLRKALGVSGIIEHKKQRRSNSDARNLVAMAGEVQHPEGFEPKPSQAVREKGPRAVEAFLDKWHAGTGTMTSRQAEDIEAMVETAEL